MGTANQIGVGTAKGLSGGLRREVLAAILAAAKLIARLLADGLNPVAGGARWDTLQALPWRYSPGHLRNGAGRSASPRTTPSARSSAATR